MSHFQSAFPSAASSVAAAVTFSVSAFFLAAAGMMATEPPQASAEPAPSHVTYVTPAVAIDPAARLLIVVEARRA